MTNHRTVSCVRRTAPWLGPLLVALAAAAACSGEDASPSDSPRSDAGASEPAVEPREALELVRDFAVTPDRFEHFARDARSALRLHEDRVLRLTREDGPGPLLEAELSAFASGKTEVWALGERGASIELVPVVATDARAEISPDGRAIYRDAVGTADIVLSLEPHALHQTIVFEDERSPAILAWNVQLGGEDLHAVVLDDGAIVVVDGSGVGRLKVSAVTLVDASGEERQIPLLFSDSRAVLQLDPTGLSYPVVADFSVSAPLPGEAFATAPVQIKGRMLVILDTSGSMIWQFNNNNNTGADGDSRAVFCDNNLFSGSDPFACNDNVACTTDNGGRPYWRLSNPTTNPSRMYAAKEALSNVIVAHSGLLDFGLERFIEDSDCSNNTYCCTPATGGSARGRCQGTGSSSSGYYYTDIPNSGTSNDLTYSGGCGTTGGGGRILVSPAAGSSGQILPWVDHVEDFCSDGSGAPRNPELRGDGNTPLARSIRTALTQWYTPIYNASKATPNPSSPLYDSLIDCRPYVLVVMTDGDDTCGTSTNGDPSQTVAALRALNGSANPPTIYTLGMGNTGGLDVDELNQMMVAGGSGLSTAPIAQNQVEIEAAFADIVSRTVKFEVCNDADDNCNTLIDEGLGVYQECSLAGQCASGTCNQGRCTCTTSAQCASGFGCSAGFCRPACVVGVGACRNTGVRKCGGGGNSACCEDDGQAACTPLQALPPGTEICNGIDDDCNGIIDDVPGGCQGCTPLPEVCNGLDDDCSGTVDDNLVDVGQPCGSSEGECSPGTTACVAGVLRCQGGSSGGAEVCNGLDDNCDTVVDGVTRSCYTGSAGTLNVGVCRGGSQNCTAVVGSGVPSWGTCVGQVLPGTETCNGLDDDCDGTTDDVPGVGTSCCPSGNCGTGICVAGTRRCSGGSLQCIGAIGPGTEVCNGLDDDCNGTIDDVPGVGSSCCPSGNCGTGACRAGNLACVGTQLVCRNAVGPSPEVCDSVDNDCNGSVDDLPGAGLACCPAGIACGIGICSDGTLQCRPGSNDLQCVDHTGPGAEVCNDLDDDCDGAVDDVPGSGQSCCTSGRCGTGICTPGIRECVGSSLSCVNEVTPKAEICDSLDNNCNGTVDDVAGIGTACCRFRNSNGDALCGVGVCTQGSLQCQSGSPTPVCVGGTGPGNEVCNGADDNCDGIVDNLPSGTVGQACCPSGKCGVGVCTAGALGCAPNGLLVCQGGITPSTEICDDLDNDCNGVVDDVPGLGQSCCPAGVACGTGICKGGTLECAPGSNQLTCSGFQGPADEICDDLDNDCNGLVDDVDGAGEACCTTGKCGVGVCKAGVRQCVGSSLACVSETKPGMEVCDNLDNDCNGEVDDVAGRGSSCCQHKDGEGNDLCGIGICTTGSRECVPGQTALRCTGGVGPATELCDALDNDCNGIVDDLPGGTVGGSCCPSGRCGTGVCAAGQLVCGASGVECSGAVNPSGEICDDLDNDCNGEVDDVPGLDTVCCPSGLCGQGICRSGRLGCGEEGLECGGGVDPEEEVCDGLDNDCNGIVDDIPRVLCCADGSPPGDPPGACNKGICRPGLTACDPQTNQMICQGAVGPESETCDGRDNDCDGAIDEEDDVVENDPKIGVACEAPEPPQDQPPCKAGATICQGGKAVCKGAVGPGEEVCDGKDNDCDGLADQGDLCGDIRACIVGVCRSPCQGGEFGCSGGLVCGRFEVEGKTGTYCVPRDVLPGSGGTGGTGGAPSGSDSGTSRDGGGATPGAGGGFHGDGGPGFGGATIDGPSGIDAGTGAAGGDPGGPGARGGAGGKNDRDFYGLATGGGGCSCRVADGPRPAGLLVSAFVLIGLAARRRDRRAA